MAFEKLLPGFISEAYLKLAGGTLTGALTLAGAPTEDLHAATKAYADSVASGANYGSNANGAYLQFAAAGVQACWHRLAFSPAGGAPIEVLSAQSFPAAFSAVPACVVTIERDNAGNQPYVLAASFYQNGLTASTYRPLVYTADATNLTTDTIYIHMLAIGTYTP